jgi:hypothetical protein
MSVDLVELGEAIGEAQATADAALETAQIAEVEATIAVAEDSSGASAESEATAHCGPDCPCHAANRELQAMLVALSDKYDEDMDTVARALDYLLGEEVEQEDAVEMISPEEAENGGESTGHQSGTEGHAAPGAGGDTEAASEAEPEPEPKHSQHKPATARRGRFKRGRR